MLRHVNFKKKFIIVICSVLLSACQSWFGPSALNDTHPAYNQAIVNSLSQEMLLNLVRLKYRDRPYFLSINSVTASMSLKSSLGISSSAKIGGASSVSPDIGISFTQSPTISYSPLGGEDFLKSVLSPIPLQAVLVMAQSGWQVERIFGLCVERLNGLANAPRASGPTPSMEPEYKPFKELIKSFNYLQTHNVVEIGVNPDSGGIEIHFLPTEDLVAQVEIKRIRLLLKINDLDKYHLSTNFLEYQPNNWNIRLRSISSILYYLSHNIDIPELHKQKGLVTNTVTKEGELFDWSKTPAGTLFKIKSAADKPDNAYIFVYYRDTWFYIADNDLNTKSTFMLLTQLFNLQAGQSKAVNPTLTIPLGVQ